MYLSTIAPCFNEEAAVERFSLELQRELSRLGLDYEIIFINDGSLDRTGEKIRELCDRHPQLRVVEHDRNRGLGAALKTGIQAARGDWLIMLDADLSFHPNQIVTLLERHKQTRADCIVGSPFIGRMDVPCVRKWTSILLNRIYQLITNQQLTAFSPIFRLYRASALRSIQFKSDGFVANVEILIRLIKAGFKIEEVPVLLGKRIAGRSKLNVLRELLGHLKLIARILTGQL